MVIALPIVLRIRRTMNGAEIDELISDVETRKARAIELARRAECKRRELCSHPSGRDKITQVTHRCHILHMIGSEIARAVSSDLADVPNLGDPRSPRRKSLRGLCLFGRHFAMKAIWPSGTLEFGCSTIASGTVRTHLFASAPFCSAEASVFAISASAITDANSAIE